MTWILKFQLSHTEPTTLPCRVVDVLHVNEQSGALFAWAEVSGNKLPITETTDTCQLILVATGMKVPEGLHIGTIKHPAHGIIYMWHVYGKDIR